MSDSRSGLSGFPRKYIEATMLIACCDHAVGVRTSRCSKTASPVLLVMRAVRLSHSIRSYGSSSAIVKYRGNRMPGPLPSSVFSPAVFLSADICSLQLRSRGVRSGSLGPGWPLAPVYKCVRRAAAALSIARRRALVCAVTVSALVLAAPASRRCRRLQRADGPKKRWWRCPGTAPGVRNDCPTGFYARSLGFVVAARVHRGRGIGRSSTVAVLAGVAGAPTPVSPCVYGARVPSCR